MALTLDNFLSQLMAQPARQASSPPRVERTESAPAASHSPAAAATLLPEVPLNPAQSDAPPSVPRPVAGLRLGSARSTGAGDAATPTPRGIKTPRAEHGGFPPGPSLPLL